MQRKPSLFAVSVLIGLILFQGLAPDLQAQGPPPPTPQQLDQLLAPIALYPDALLAQITTASTNPQEILDVDNWLAQNQNLSVSQLTAAAQQQGFDPAFIALVGFPQVIQMMAENIDDYAAIGAAVMANQAEVSASIQRLRAQAYASGALRSTPQQVVEVQQDAGQPIYVIQPANPQVVYLPQYNPTVVYGAPARAWGWLRSALPSGLQRSWSASHGDGAAGDGTGEAGGFITTVARGAVGEAAIGHRICGIGRARCCITTGLGMAATGDTGHRITGRRNLSIAREPGPGFTHPISR